MKTEQGLPSELIFLFFNDTSQNSKRPELTGNIEIEGERKRIALWKRSAKKHGGRIENPDKSTFVRVEMYQCRSSEKKSILKLLPNNGPEDNAICYLLQLVEKNGKAYYRGAKKAIPNRNK